MPKRRREDDEGLSDDEHQHEHASAESDYEPADAVSLTGEDDVHISDTWEDGQGYANGYAKGQLLPVDDNYGLRPMFDATQLKVYDSDQEVEDTDPVAAYLAQVNTERRALPALVNSNDQQAVIEQEQADEEERGCFVDGYYAVKTSAVPPAPADADESYFDTIIEGYQSIRDVLEQPWTMDELIELGRYGYLSLRFEESDNNHRANLATVILPLHQPREIEIKYMDPETAWSIIRDALKLYFADNKGKPIGSNIGMWLYFLLARVEPMHSQASENLSDLRQLVAWLIEARDALDDSPDVDLVNDGGDGELREQQQTTRDLESRYSAQQAKWETCQIVDTMLIIVGVYFRQRDLLESRKPLPMRSGGVNGDTVQHGKGKEDAETGHSMVEHSDLPATAPQTHGFLDSGPDRSDSQAQEAVLPVDPNGDVVDIVH